MGKLWFLVFGRERPKMLRKYGGGKKENAPAAYKPPLAPLKKELPVRTTAAPLLVSDVCALPPRARAPVLPIPNRKKTLLDARVATLGPAPSFPPKNRLLESLFSRQCASRFAVPSGGPSKPAWRLQTRAPSRLTADMAAVLKLQPGLSHVILLGFLRRCDMLVSYSFQTCSLQFELQLWTVAPNLTSFAAACCVSTGRKREGCCAGPAGVALAARIPLFPGAAQAWLATAGVSSTGLLDGTSVKVLLWEAPQDGTLVAQGWLPAPRSTASRSAAGSSRLPITHFITVIPPMHRPFASGALRLATVAAARRAWEQPVQEPASGPAASAPLSGLAFVGDSDFPVTFDDNNDSFTADVTGAVSAGLGGNAPIPCDLAEGADSGSHVRALHTSCLVAAPYPKQTVLGLQRVCLAAPGSGSALLSGHGCYRLVVNTGDALRVLTLLVRPVGLQWPAADNDAATCGVRLARRHSGGRLSALPVDASPLPVVQQSIVRVASSAVGGSVLRSDALLQRRMLEDARAYTTAVARLSERLSAPGQLVALMPWFADLLAPPGAAAHQVCASVVRPTAPVGLGFRFLSVVNTAAASQREATVRIVAPVDAQAMALQLTWARCLAGSGVRPAMLVLATRSVQPLCAEGGVDASGAALLASRVAAWAADAAAAAGVGALGWPRDHPSTEAASSVVAAARPSRPAAQGRRLKAAARSAVTAVAVASLAPPTAVAAVSILPVSSATSECPAAECVSSGALAAAGAAAVALCGQSLDAGTQYGLAGDVALLSATSLDIDELLQRLMRGRVVNYDMRLVAIVDSGTAEAWRLAGSDGSSAAANFAASAALPAHLDMLAEASQDCAVVDAEGGTACESHGNPACVAAGDADRRERGSARGRVRTATRTAARSQASVAGSAEPATLTMGVAAASAVHAAAGSEVLPPFTVAGVAPSPGACGECVGDARYALFVVVVDHDVPLPAAPVAAATAGPAAAAAAAVSTPTAPGSDDVNPDAPTLAVALHLEQPAGPPCTAPKAAGRLGAIAKTLASLPPLPSSSSTRAVSYRRNRAGAVVPIAVTSARPVKMPTLAAAAATASDWDDVVADSTAGGRGASAAAPVSPVVPQQAAGCTSAPDSFSFAEAEEEGREWGPVTAARAPVTAAAAAAAVVVEEEPPPLSLAAPCSAVIRSRLMAVCDVLTGAVRVAECRKLPPRQQPAFDGQRGAASAANTQRGVPGSGATPPASRAVAPVPALQSLATVASEALTAARARFFGSSELLLRPDGWDGGRVRELDNYGVVAGRSLAKLVHPIYPLAVVAPAATD